MMGATITIVIKGSVLAAMPVTAYSVLSLLKPWLPKRFWRFLAGVTAAAMVSSVLGILFVYYVMLPVGLGFLLSFGTEVAVPLIDIGRYLELVSALMTAMIFVFLIPVGMFTLAKMRVLRYRHFRWGRLLVPLFATFLGIILTPTADGVNFLLVSTPVLGLYEVGLFSTWLVNPEEGNYLWLKTVHGWITATWNRIAWVLRRPIVAYRWVRDKLMTHGFWW
jgi:sec-independent protein translocase protein TatC